MRLINRRRPTHTPIDRDEIKAVVMTCGPDPSPDLADGRAVSDMADNEDRDHDEGRL